MGGGDADAAADDDDDDGGGPPWIRDFDFDAISSALDAISESAEENCRGRGRSMLSCMWFYALTIVCSLETISRGDLGGGGVGTGWQ